jgi:uncharacterized protein YjbI with pentapeptide repeats
MNASQTTKYNNRLRSMWEDMDPEDKQRITDPNMSEDENAKNHLKRLRENTLSNRFADLTEEEYKQTLVFLNVDFRRILLPFALFNVADRLPDGTTLSPNIIPKLYYNCNFEGVSLPDDQYEIQKLKGTFDECNMQFMNLSGHIVDFRIYNSDLRNANFDYTVWNTV